jgi:hypothetical protein
VTSVPSFTFPNTDLQTAYQNINTPKSTCGLGLYAYNADIAVAAVNHSNYIAANVVAHPDALSHTETSSYLDYTGVTPSDRLSYAGYGNFPAGEVIGHSEVSASPATDAVASLFGTVYHMTIMMDSGSFDIGIGAAATQVEGTTFVTIDTGNKLNYYQDIGPSDLATYPCGGQAISLQYQSNTSDETPNPLPGHNYSANPVGQPILVAIQHGRTIAISSMTLTAANGTTISAAAILTGTNDPNKELELNQAVFIPSAPLTVGTSYTVVVNGTNDGVAFSRTFTFSTTA